MTFDVDHNQLQSGIYVSKIATGLPGIDKRHAVVTYDVRLRKPYTDNVLSIETLHTLEHIFSKVLRDAFEPLKLTVLYEGCMGCQTGFYFVLYGDKTQLLDPSVIGSTLSIAMQAAIDLGYVPAKEKIRCGNVYTLLEHNEIVSELEYLRGLADTIRITNRFNEYTLI